jgi:hypothetical protein
MEGRHYFERLVSGIVKLVLAGVILTILSPLLSISVEVLGHDISVVVAVLVALAPLLLLVAGLRDLGAL